MRVKPERIYHVLVVIIVVVIVVVVVVVVLTQGGLGRHVDRIRCPPRGSWKVLSETSIRILPASRYIFAVQRASYSICSTPKAPEQSPRSHVATRASVWMPGRHVYVCESISVWVYVRAIYYGDVERENGTGTFPLVPLHPAG